MSKVMKLRDWLPVDADINDKRIVRHLDCPVAREETCTPFPQRNFTYRNINNWCLLINGYAVGWNESPRSGWAFVLSTPTTVQKFFDEE